MVDLIYQQFSSNIVKRSCAKIQQRQANKNIIYMAWKLELTFLTFCLVKMALSDLTEELTIYEFCLWPHTTKFWLRSMPLTPHKKQVQILILCSYEHVLL